MSNQGKLLSRNIEVLIMKAAVDGAFKGRLLELRGEAAKSIGLELSATEAILLAAIPRDQLETIINQTEVPPESRRAFLGAAAAAMTAALGIGYACIPKFSSRGSRPSREYMDHMRIDSLESRIDALEVELEDLPNRLKAQNASMTTESLNRAATSTVVEIRPDAQDATTPSASRQAPDDPIQ